jgi:hypothetical protein
MEIKRTDFDNIRQDVNKIKKYASDLQTFIGVNENLRLSDIPDKKILFCLSISEIFVVISDFIFSNVPSMSSRSLSMWAMAVSFQKR